MQGRRKGRRGRHLFFSWFVSIPFLAPPGSVVCGEDRQRQAAGRARGEQQAREEKKTKKGKTHDTARWPPLLYVGHGGARGSAAPALRKEWVKKGKRAGGGEGMFCLRVASLVAKWWWGERDKKTNAKKKENVQGAAASRAFPSDKRKQKEMGAQRGGAGGTVGVEEKK